MRATPDQSINPPPAPATPVASPHHRDEPILVVDDEGPVRELLSRLLKAQGFHCQSASTGKEALEKLGKRTYSLVITDIRMPAVNGLELLDSLKRCFPDTAVIMITGVADLDTAIGTMKNGAADYLTKPFHLDQVAASVTRALELRKQRLRERGVNRELRRLVERKSSDLSSALRDVQAHRDMILEALVKSLDARENETQCHSQRVRAYTLHLSRCFEFDAERLRDISRGALLHDIGKIGVADSILLKPGKLNEAEWREMKRHPVIGFEMLKGFEFLQRAARMVLYHHERYDGSGYPHGLRATGIPLEARIFAVTDAYDAITSDRPYRRALPPSVAVSEITDNSGTQFDPSVVEAFLRVPQSEWNEIRQNYS